MIYKLLTKTNEKQGLYTQYSPEHEPVELIELNDLNFKRILAIPELIKALENLNESEKCVCEEVDDKSLCASCSNEQLLESVY